MSTVGISGGKASIAQHMSLPLISAASYWCERAAAQILRLNSG
jgi:hypothetical protein